MHLSPTLKETIQHTKQKRLPLNITINNGKDFFISSNISNTYALIFLIYSKKILKFEIQARISKAWSVLGTMKNFLKGKVIDP
jgi:hypothetical protein